MVGYVECGEGCFEWSCVVVGGRFVGGVEFGV